MKSRSLILISVVVAAMSLVALVLSAVSRVNLERVSDAQSIADQAGKHANEPALVQDSGDPSSETVLDSITSPDTRLKGNLPSGTSKASHRQFIDTPWHPPVASQTASDLSNGWDTWSPESPSRQRHKSAGANTLQSVGSPAERLNELAAADFTALSPVASLQGAGKAAFPRLLSPQAHEPPPAGVNVDMAYDVLFGYVSAGDLVTATAFGGSAFGATYADGVGFYFTPLWGTDGRQVDLVGGESIDVYINGTFLQSIILPTFSGELQTTTEQVVGNLGGVSADSEVTASLGIWAWEPNSETPRATATTDGLGDFTASFSEDVGPHNFARIDTIVGGGHVYHYAYPGDEFNVDTFNWIFGYAEPYQPVTVTVYVAGTSTVRGSQTVYGYWPHGDYGAELEVVPGDTIEVDLGGGNLQTLDTSLLTASVNLSANVITGQAPALQPVRVFLYNWMLGTYTETQTTTDAGGNYTATFPAYDLTAQDNIYPAYAAVDGSEVMLSVFPPRITAHTDWNAVAGSADTPLQPFTYTLNQGGMDYTISGQTDATNGTGWVDFGALGVDIVAGDIITLETATWSGSMVVADLTLTADTTNDGYLGNADLPGEVTIVSFPWPAWTYPVYRMASGTAPATPSFSIAMPGQDVRAGTSGRVLHYDANNFATRKDFEVRYFNVVMPWGVSSPQYDPDEVITATLYESDQTTIKRQVSTDNDGSAEWYWLKFDGEIAAGDWMSVTNGSDWGGWLQVPDLTTTIDRATDLITGKGSQGLLYVDGWDPASSFGAWAPTYPSGGEQVYAVDASAYGMDMDFGTGAAVSYQALDGNRAQAYFAYPNLTARYNPDGSSTIFGGNAIPGNTIYITITNSLDEVVASGTTEAGSGWWGATSYALEFPDYSLTPGDLIAMDFGSGLQDTLLIVELTAQADIATDLVTGLAPADALLRGWIGDSVGNWTELKDVQVSTSGTYTLDFGSIGWDVNNGDSISVYYLAGHGHEIERNINLPRPELYLSVYNTNGGAQPGGPYAFGVNFSNDGELAAQDVQVVVTLPPSTTLAGDTFGVTPEIGAGGVVTWSLGTLAPYEQRNVFVTVLLDPAHPTGDGALAPLCGSITTSTSGDSDPGNDSACSGTANVQVDDIDIRVDKWPNPGDVVAGQEFVYDVQYCNDRFAAAGPVWLTDTLPVSTTFVSLEPRNWWGEVFWSEQTVNDGVLQLYFPSMPGQNCTNLNLRLLADPALPLNTTLSNRVEVSTAGDINPDNNVRMNEEARISNPRADLNLGKYFNNGVLTPGNEYGYKLDYWNSGNILVSGRLTDTLPAGTAYVEGSAYDYNGQPIDPVLVMDDVIVWDVGEIGVSWGFGLTYRLLILESTAPGTALLNCATIAPDAEEDTPYNNTACDEQQVYEHGPNLRVSKYHEWYGDGWLHYEIDLSNVGDEGVYSPIVTDTYPLSTTFAGWGHDYWEWIDLIVEDPGNHTLSWQLNRMEPGWGTRIRFDAPLDTPGQRMVWYTNTVEISAPEGETNPADNTYTDVAFSGGEVDQFEMWVGTDHSDAWGSAQPDSTVSVLNQGETYTAYADPSCGGCWSMPDIGPVWPGYTFTVTAGAGLMPVEIHVPDPFDVASNSQTDQVTGQLGVDPGSWLRVELNGYSGKDAQVDASGYYTVTFNDIPRGGQGHVRYETTMDLATAVFHRRYQSPDLLMSTNVAHDWVQGRYELGHTVWITVTESDGVTEKAHAQVETYNIPWWGGQPGFEPQGDDWVPSHPDIQEGDWVYGLVDNGYTSTIHIGSITGSVDPDNDRIEGTVLAEWISQPVELRCHTWGSPNGEAPQKQDYVQPDGVDVYTCAWDPLSEWDVLAGQDIGVEYYEPDGDSVFNAFHAPSPDIGVQVSSHGNAGEGGNLQLQVQYINQGELDANNVVITQTLEGMQYLDDTSGMPIVTGINPSGDPYVVFQLGTLPPGNWLQFDVFAQVTAPALETITSTARIAGTPDGGNPDDNERSWSGQVLDNDTHVNLGKGAWTGDPTPGGQFVWEVNTCNNGSTGSSALVLTDTLPAHMALLNWWGQHAGWTEVSSDASELVVMRPSLPQGWCSQVYLRFLVDVDAPVGTNIENIAEVWAANDLESNDNQASNWVNINNPHTNINVNKWWGGGSLVPGGTFRYHMQYQNNGNVPVDGVLITDTLPVSTTLNYIQRFDRHWSFIEDVTPLSINGNQVVWVVGSIENGEVGHYEVSVRADEDAAPGTLLVNTVEISHLPGEDTYDDNTSTWTETLFDHGPNLRLSKRYWWNGDSQLGYQIDFANIGDQTVAGVWITDTLPENTQWDGWWNMGFDWNRLVTSELTPGQLRWQFSEMYPGDSGWLQFNANLDDPIARPRWYTNTAEISLHPDESNPEDNIATTETVLGEVERVELWVSQGSYGMWGEAMPGVTVTVTKGAEQFTAWADPGCGGCWNIGDIPWVTPGETITVTAGAGLLPVVITAPDPFSVQADSSTDTVWGQIDQPGPEVVNVHLDGYGGMNVQTDENGNFAATFADIPPGGNGEVRYDTTIDYAHVYFHHRFQAEDLLLRVNYGHDWLQAIYPAGHTVWITVTDSLDVEKATYEEITYAGGAWGSDGFESQGHLWSPNQPDIAEGDWIQARSDDGRTAEVHIGEITGDLDLDTDSVSGTITAPFVETLRMTCQVWTEDAPEQIEGSVDPAGGSYNCSWAGVYDLQPDMNVAVSYFEPVEHQIINVFSIGRPHLYINKWADGQPSSGGQYTFHIHYANQGNGPAENVLITDTLSAGMTYLGGTSPFPLVSNDPLVWDLGTLPNGADSFFDVYVQVDAPAGTALSNTAQIGTSNPWENSPPRK